MTLRMRLNAKYILIYVADDVSRLRNTSANRKGDSIYFSTGWRSRNIVLILTSVAESKMIGASSRSVILSFLDKTLFSNVFSTRIIYLMRKTKFGAPEMYRSRNCLTVKFSGSNEVSPSKKSLITKCLRMRTSFCRMKDAKSNFRFFFWDFYNWKTEIVDSKAKKKETRSNKARSSGCHNHS